MKKNLKLLGIFAFITFLVGTFSACSKYNGFKEDKETGIYYKFYTENISAPQPLEGDLIEFTYRLRTADSILVDPRHLMQDLIQPSKYNGDLNVVYKMMHLGDSATFILDGDAFYQSVGKEFEFEKKELYVDIKLTKITSKAELDEIRKIEMEQAKALKLAEDSLIRDYIIENNIKVKPSKSGLYYISQKEGKGKKAENGKIISVHYTGKLLDGTVFDSSIQRGEPIRFQLGEGMFISGWEEGIALMNEGGKAILILPSSLAYGERATESIPSYSPLVFEIELVAVSDKY